MGADRAGLATRSTATTRAVACPARSAAPCAPGSTARNHVVLLVRDLDAATAEALGYLRSFRPDDVHAVYPAAAAARCRPRRADAVASVRRRRHPDLEPLTGRGDLLAAASARYVRTISSAHPTDFVTVSCPRLRPQGLFRYLLRSRDLIRLKASLLREPNVVVTDVPVVIERGQAPPASDARPLIPQRTVTLVFVSRERRDDPRGQLRAIARRRRDPRDLLRPRPRGGAQRSSSDWFDARMEMPLDIVEAPFRDLTGPDARRGPPIHRARRHRRERDHPRVRGASWWQLPLHNQTALFVKRLFLFEERARAHGRALPPRSPRLRAAEPSTRPGVRAQG